MSIVTLSAFLKGQGVPAQAIVANLVQVVLRFVFVVNDETTVDQLRQLVVDA